MPKFAALLQFLLALGGCAMGGTTYTHRISQDGHDVLASEARLQDGVARFDCDASDSGWCHYTLYADACEAGSGCTQARRPIGEVSENPKSERAGRSRRKTPRPSR